MRLNKNKAMHDVLFVSASSVFWPIKAFTISWTHAEIKCYLVNTRTKIGFIAASEQHRNHNYLLERKIPGKLDTKICIMGP